MALKYFGDLPQGGYCLVQVALVKFSTHGGGNAPPEGGRKNTAAVRSKSARRRHPLKAGLYSSAGEAEALGEDHDGQAGIFVQSCKDAAVGRVEFLQYDHSCRELVNKLGQSDQAGGSLLLQL